MEIVVQPKRVTKYLALIVGCLTLAHIAGQSCRFFLGHDTVLGLVPMFSFRVEASIPSMFSSVTLLFCSALLAVIGSAKKKTGTPCGHWMGLAAVFLFLSVDDSVRIHERVNGLLQTALKTSGFLYYPWVIPYGIGLIVLILVYRKFIMSLPKRTRNLFVIAGLLCVAGAMGVELLEARHFELYGHDAFFMLVLETIEESVEKAGIVVFVYAIMSYMDSELGDLRLRISSSPAESPQTKHDTAAGTT